jgi:branched-subunit amino acid transport protein
MEHNIYLYILVAAITSSLIRILPLTLIRGKIENRFIQSFLFYIPYVTLAVMTFPAIVEATQIPAAGIVALLLGIAAAWYGASLFQVAVLCCGIVFIIQLAAGWIM